MYRSYLTESYEFSNFGVVSSDSYVKIIFYV